MTAPLATLRPPFPYPGGKRLVAPVVWRAFGDVPNYCEPFAGSLAVLLGRPSEPRIETVNDINCFIANFWRALQKAPDEVANWADWPVNEADLHARHLKLTCDEEFRERMKTDPEYFNAMVAGWWVWGISQWIGTGWCAIEDDEPRRQLPNIRGCDGAAGNGIHASALVRKIPILGGSSKGVHSSGSDQSNPRSAIIEWMRALAARLRRVRVCCGDWARILGPSATTQIGVTGVLLDAPYPDGHQGMYAHHDAQTWFRAREWAIENGNNPKFRIAFCGYRGEHDMPSGWTFHDWKANGGYGSQRRDKSNVNAERERVWFSPHCLPIEEPQGDLFTKDVA